MRTGKTAPLSGSAWLCSRHPGHHLSELHGYYVVMVKGSKIGLDKELAKKIIVYAN